MESMFILVPISIILAFAIGYFFWWSGKNGQFDDLEGPAHRIRQVDFVFFAVYFERDVSVGQVEFFGKAAEQDFAAVVIQHGAFEG